MLHCLTYTCCTPLTNCWQSKIFVIYIYIYICKQHTDELDSTLCTQEFPIASIAEFVYVIVLSIKQLTNPMATLKWFDSYEYQVIMIFQYVGAESGCLYSWLDYALPYLKLVTWKESKLLIVILINEICALYRLYWDSYLLSNSSAVSVVI